MGFPTSVADEVLARCGRHDKNNGLLLLQQPLRHLTHLFRFYCLYLRPVGVNLFSFHSFVSSDFYVILGLCF